MSFLPSFLFRSRTQQTVVRLRTFHHFIRVWLQRGPAPSDDYQELAGWVLANRPVIDQRPQEESMAEMIRLFPRIQRIEFMNGSLTEGVVVNV